MGDWMRAALIARELDPALVAAGVRHVRTPEGAKHFGQPIGSPIVKDPTKVARRMAKGAFTRPDVADDPIFKPIRDRDSEVLRLSTDLNQRAQAFEPETTAMLQDVVGAAGGHMQGLEFRFKAVDTMAKKIRTKTDQNNRRARQRGVPLVTDADSAAKIGDALRYTAILGPDEYTETGRKVLAELERRGHHVVQVKNTWPKGDDYSGVNVKMLGPNGLPWELQFHTEQSFQTKEFGTHKDYEIYRDPDQPMTERWLAYRRMVRLWEKVKQPKNWETWGTIIEPQRVPVEFA